MILIKHTDEDHWIVHHQGDVCYTYNIKKATVFDSVDSANQYKDKWDLWDYEVVENANIR